jgi:hypothetical protein
MSRPLILLLLLSSTVAPGLRAQDPIAQYTRGMERHDGYVPFYWDGTEGRLLLEIGALDRDFLYLTSLATGIGSTEVGLDRGMIAGEAIARFERTGPSVFLVFINHRFRASATDNMALQRSVEESFPTSTMAAFDVVAEAEGRVLVDATEHFLTDHVDVTGRLRRGDHGSYRLTAERSRIYLPRTRAFPTNTEIEVQLTFVTDDASRLMTMHAPTGNAITVRQHHSLVQLPDPGFSPRVADPRIGNFGVTFLDFAQALDRRYERRYVARHRLQKQDAGAERAAPVTPIVYYLDRGIPEPYRSAFKDGAEWWNAVFEAAGFIDAFRVEDMPEGMDPMDARYHVIQWVHRSDAGYSIGPSVVDPRTGEIIKAAVRMDSYRSLTDYNIYAGAVPTGAPPEALDLASWLASQDPAVTAEAFTMARRRQHAAHEVGHTLGLAHNYIAASYGRASVMDYPAPLVELVDGAIRLENAYRDGPGAYDSIAIRYAYTEIPPEQEGEELAAIVAEATERGLLFNTDGDQPTWGSYPEVTQWTNGADAVEELARVAEVRRHLLDRFDERVLNPQEPMAWMNYRLVPVYLHHRYALEAAIKAVGGLEFRYAVHGDSLPPTTIISPARQRRALELVLDELEPDALEIPADVLPLMAPRAYGYGSNEWFLRSPAYPAFDQVSAARMLAAMIVDNLLDRRRVARLVALHDREPEVPSPEEVIARLIDRAWPAHTPAEQATLRRVVQRVTVDALIDLAGHSAATVESRGAAEWGLRRILETVQADDPRSPEAQAHRQLLWGDIERFLNRRDEGTQRSAPIGTPPGTPIGGQ